MLSFKILGAFAAFTSTFLIPPTAAQNFCIHGINYNPRMGPDWAPVNQRCKSVDSIKADMETLVHVTHSVRLYGLGDCDQSSTVIPAAISAGLTVSLGLWVSEDDAVFEAEFLKLQALIQQNAGIFSNGSVVDIHVGSEAIYRKEVTAAKNIENLQRVKALLQAYNLEPIPVTIAEIGDVYLANPELTDAVDFIQANGFPFWERIVVDNAVAYFESRMEPLFQQALARDKKVVIGETGWASGGDSLRASEASPVNAAHYFYDFFYMAKQKNVEFYYFEGFDESWKTGTTNDTVEGYFGLFTEDRTLKPEIAVLSLGGSCTGTNEEASAPGSNSNGVYTPSNSGSSESGSAYTPGTVNPDDNESGGATTMPPTTNPDECHVRRSLAA